MRIALPLCLAALLISVPALAAPASAPAPADQTRAGKPRVSQAARPAAAARPATASPARQATRTSPSRSRTATAAATRPATTQAATAAPSASRSTSARLPRVIHGLNGRSYARGVEAAHPGLQEPETDAAAPQLVHFPGAAPRALPAVLLGGPTEGVAPSPSGGYCGQMLMPAAMLREISRGFRPGHAGIDLMAPHGSPIRAAAAGTVIYAGWYYAYGNIVDIRHGDGVVTRYAHMSAFGPGIGAGADVRAGDVIGNVGATGRATGPHIHFEVRIGGRAVDPRPYLALASCDGTSPRDEILEAYADERPRASARRPAARSTRQAAVRSKAPQPVKR